MRLLITSQIEIFKEIYGSISVGRPNVTLKKILLDDTGPTCDELQNVMKDRDRWRSDFVKASPIPSGIG